MIKRPVLCLLFIISGFSNLFSQSLPVLKEFLAQGLYLKGGLAYNVVKDQFISKEKYSGYSPYYILGWSKYHETYGLNLTAEFLNNAEVKNYNMSANIIEFSLGAAYTYDIGRVDIFSKKTYLMLGPAPEIFIHFRNENIAKGGSAVLDAYSFAMLFSAGIRFEAIMPISHDFLIAGIIHSNLISLGGKLTDLQEKKIPMLKFTYFLNDEKLSAELSARYRLFDPVILEAGYKFRMLRLSSWDYMISTADNFLLTIGWTL